MSWNSVWLKVVTQHVKEISGIHLKITSGIPSGNPLKMALGVSSFFQWFFLKFLQGYPNCFPRLLLGLFGMNLNWLPGISKPVSSGKFFRKLSMDSSRYSSKNFQNLFQDLWQWFLQKIPTEIFPKDYLTFLHQTSPKIVSRISHESLLKIPPNITHSSRHDYFNSFKIPRIYKSFIPGYLPWHSPYFLLRILILIEDYFFKNASKYFFKKLKKTFGFFFQTML